MESLFICIFKIYKSLLFAVSLSYNNLISGLLCAQYLISFMMNMHCFVVVTTSRESLCLFTHIKKGKMVYQ